MALEDLVEFEGVEVLLENLRFLARDMAHGGKKELALKLGVDPNTVSRWFSGRHHPPAEKLRDIADCFSLKSDVDLASSRLFLSLEPISALQRRHWLHNRVDALCDEDLSALFPALRKLFD